MTDTKMETAGMIACGPLLRFNDVELPANVWTGSVMLVLRCHAASMAQNPVLEWRVVEGGESANGDDAEMKMNRVEALVLYEYAGHRFVRYDLRVPQHQDVNQSIAYSIAVNDQEKINQTFHVPAVSTRWRYMFFSCNGFCNDVDRKAYNDVQPLWADVMRKHTDEHAYHAMIGGGDQVYSDDVFYAPAVKKWLDMDGIYCARQSSDQSTQN